MKRLRCGRRATASLGPIDVLVNNAGWDVFKPFLKTSPADWQKAELPST